MTPNLSGGDCRFLSLNTGLIAAQVFASHLHVALRITLPLLGVIFTFCWFLLLRRMWHYQDFQAAVLRDQEHAMSLDIWERIVALTQSATNLLRSIFPE